MMEKTKDSSGAEKNVSSRSIIAMGKRGVNRFPPLESTPSVGIGALERGDRVVRCCRDYANQCSAFVGTGTGRTSRSSALTGVVSECQPKTGKKATRAGCDHVFCTLASVGLTLVEK